MSPAYTNEALNIKRVAVIGAGPGGLAAAKYLDAEKSFDTIQVFDQRAMPGGVWNYSSVNVLDDDFSVPRTVPTTRNDTAVRSVDQPDVVQFVSPIYDALETNIPHTLMNYSDLPFPEGSSLFPRHEDVLLYLKEYARDIAHFLRLSTQVLRVRHVRAGRRTPVWEMDLLDLTTNTPRTEQFDAVLVASGHYNDPFIPGIAGLEDFNKLHPGVVSHSKFYRSPEMYRGKKVIVVGNSASGIDISAQIATVAQTPVIVSEKALPATPVEDRAWSLKKPQIVEFLRDTDTVKSAVLFEDGSIEADIDAVVFCTGYFYSFPFLPNLNPPVITDGACARNLFEHVLYIDDPTLAFLGIPQRVVPLPIAEAQAAWVARLWSDRLAMPPVADMRAWEADLVRARGESKSIHNLAFPMDVNYINSLYTRSLAATPRNGLDNNGAGKHPPYWNTEKAWVRERFPFIKIASRALGEKRSEVKSLAELGFIYTFKSE